MVTLIEARTEADLNTMSVTHRYIYKIGLGQLQLFKRMGTEYNDVINNN